jgi:hypothetical protein
MICRIGSAYFVLTGGIFTSDEIVVYDVLEEIREKRTIISAKMLYTLQPVEGI